MWISPMRPRVHDRRDEANDFPVDLGAETSAF
jgi:hypothetical protein